MVAPLNVPGIQAQGNVKLQVCPTIDLETPSLADLTDTGSLDVSGLWYTWAPTAETSKFTARRRVATKRQLQKSGTVTEDIPDLEYMINPQAASGADGKKAFELLPEGTMMYVVERLGLDVDTDFAVGQFVIIRYVRFGHQHVSGDPSAEENEVQVTQSVSLQEPGSSELVVLVA